MSTRNNLLVLKTVIKLSAFAADIKLPAFAGAFDNNLPCNSELECEQDHEYSP